MWDLLSVNLLELAQIVPLKVLTLLPVRIIMTALSSGWSTSCFAEVANQDGQKCGPITTFVNLFFVALLVTVRANVNLFGLTSRCATLDFCAIEQGHFFHATRALEDLRIDGVASNCLPTTAIATSLIQPVDLWLNIARKILERALKAIHIHRCAVVLGYKGRCRAPINGDGLTALHERGQRRTARAAEGVENEVARLGVVPDILPDGVVRLFRPVGVHVVDSRSRRSPGRRAVP
jgi:hypothetical protein